MMCPKCGAWSSVLDTRQQDRGHRNNRRRQCANGHRFSTVEVHAAVYCSAKPRQGVFLQTVKARADLHLRNAAILRRLAAGEPGADIAASLGVSPSTVSLVKRAAERAESAHAIDQERRNHPGAEPRPAGRGSAP